MERLCITSYLAHGHSFRLHAYDELSNVPTGVEMVDASLSIPRDRIWKYSNGSLAGFANEYRYKSLFDGGVWVDMDTVCLKPLEFSSDVVISSEVQPKGGKHMGFSLVKFSPNHPVIESCYNDCLRLGKPRCNFGTTGPKLLAKHVARYNLEHCVVDPVFYNPVWWKNADRFVTKEPHPISEKTIVVHLYAETWRRTNRDKNGTFPKTSNYEVWKNRFGVTTENLG
ncbi:MAG: hypothetical protein ABGX04_00810 [Myxococcales bacterium]|nr:hypothetical protein [Myxococcales bacterium]HIL79736.1 hypothetical protein [Myxococcales bacterium]